MEDLVTSLNKKLEKSLSVVSEIDVWEKLSEQVTIISSHPKGIFWYKETPAYR